MNTGPEQPVSFDEAIRDATAVSASPHLLLGNGFSIACRPDCFHYGTLLNEARFPSRDQEIRGTFDLLSTADFERVIEQLRSAAQLAEHFNTTDPALAAQLRSDANAVRTTLAATLADRHPDVPADLTDDEYRAARNFLSHFGRIYTLNYDVLLYWCVMNSDVDNIHLVTDDGFRNPSDATQETDYVTWEPYRDFASQRLFFLHGGLHLYDRGTEISKITWSRTGIPLIDQIRQALQEGKYPLIVTEGGSAEKEAKALHNPYLNHGIRSFARLTGALVVYGHSLAPNDDHILHRIRDGKLSHLYISLYGDPTSPENAEIQARAHALEATRTSKRPLTITFFDAESAQPWG